jgi:hypothetical protein
MKGIRHGEDKKQSVECGEIGREAAVAKCGGESNSDACGAGGTQDAKRRLGKFHLGR